MLTYIRPASFACFRVFSHSSYSRELPPAKALDAASLARAVAAIPRTATCLLVCHFLPSLSTADYAVMVSILSAV